VEALSYDEKMKLSFPKFNMQLLAMVSIVYLSAMAAMTCFEYYPQTKISNTKEAVAYIEDFIQRKQKKFPFGISATSLVGILNSWRINSVENITGSKKCIAAAPLAKTQLWQSHQARDCWVCIFQGENSNSVVAFVSRNGEVEVIDGGHLLLIALGFQTDGDVMTNWPKDTQEQLELVLEARKNGSKCIYY